MARLSTCGKDSKGNEGRTERLRHWRPLHPALGRRAPESQGAGVLAEREGFEPPEGFPSTVFKTAAFDRSATSPGDISYRTRPGGYLKICNYFHRTLSKQALTTLGEIHRM